MDLTKVVRIRWTKQEKSEFVRLFKTYGVQFKMYVPFFQNRKVSQIKSYYHNVIHKNKVIQAEQKNVLKVWHDDSQPLMKSNTSNVGEWSLYHELKPGEVTDFDNFTEVI
ncbi:SANT/Myb_domain [Hexamita inflata]|uniref:SANT/Myb domain n=1 Tax=Hexamita inflata TaxID=28002 RepID=A0AA86N573_9EUKA|nr:SANT/Myb domain [Hexamita inflata]